MICPLSCDDFSCLRCCAFPVRRSTTRLPSPPTRWGKSSMIIGATSSTTTSRRRSKFGIPTHHLPDVSYAHAQWNAEFGRSIVQRLDRLDTTGLSEDDRLTFEILRWENQLAVDGLPYFWYRFQVAPYSFRRLGIQQIFTMQRLNDAERSRLLAELPRVVDGWRGRV